MTNLEIQQHAAHCAAMHITSGTHLEPDEAWEKWSAASGVVDPGARVLFESEYALSQREAPWKQLMSTATCATGWRSVLHMIRVMRAM